jgi:hypothetical protein
MRIITFFLIISVFALSCDSSLKKQVAKSTFNTVNAVLGDVSFEKLYGRLPSSTDNYQSRIITHLQYVYHKLKSEGIESQNRKEVLQHLDDYITQTQFPINKKYKDQTRPCFIDDEGNICAVGYLIEQTEGRAAAESINKQFQYAYVDQMPDELIEPWAKKWGLTKDECAMIQPQYNWRPNQTDLVLMGSCIIFNSLSMAYSLNLKSPIWTNYTSIGLSVGTFVYHQSLWNNYYRETIKYSRDLNYALGGISILANSFSLYRKYKSRLNPDKSYMSLNYSQIPTFSPTLAPFANGLRLSYRF